MFGAHRSSGCRNGRARGGKALTVLGWDLKGVVWDWGDTLMKDIPGQSGPMVHWPVVEAMPGASAALKALSELPVQCVATNATESNGAQVAEALGRVGLRQYLTHFFTSGELGLCKPDSSFFEKVSEKLRIPPTSLVSVGNDLQKDIAPAKAVGMKTVLLSSAPEGDEEQGADLIVASLSELAVLVQ